MSLVANYKNIKIEINGHVGCVTLDRQKDNNALNIETSKEIYEGFKELESNSSVRAILIQGNQKLFSPGADIKELNSLNTNSAKEKGLFNYFDKIKEIKIPIVASVEGYALGGGMELALLCDIIIASKEAKFGQPEINSGVRAYELGIVNILLDKENFSAEAFNIAKKISEKPKSSLIEIKKLISNNQLLDQGLEEERQSFYNLLDHENSKIGINAFLNKAKADWKD